MVDLSFVQLATDPNLIPGVYNGCDQWCDYCPVTARCLAFKCQPAQCGCNTYDNIADAMRASMILLKNCHETEGLKPPEKLLQLLDNDPRERVTTAGSWSDLPGTKGGGRRSFCRYGDCVRVTPALYNTPQEVDRLAAALKQMAAA